MKKRILQSFVTPFVFISFCIVATGSLTAHAQAYNDVCRDICNNDTIGALIGELGGCATIKNPGAEDQTM